MYFSATNEHECLTNSRHEFFDTQETEFFQKTQFLQIASKRIKNSLYDFALNLPPVSVI